MVSGTIGGLTDLHVDGSRCEETHEARQKWVEWFDSLEPVFTGEDLARFETALSAARAEQKALLPKWQAKVGELLK